MKGIKCCGECAYYSMKKHKCTRGFTAGEASESFFTDCDLPDAELVKHGKWIITEKDKLMPTGKIAVSEGHILHKTSFDEPFTLQSANIIQIKEHRTVKRPYCSICGNYGDDEYDKTPYCPNCGARMDGDENDSKNESDKDISDNAYLFKRSNIPTPNKKPPMPPVNPPKAL